MQFYFRLLLVKLFLLLKVSECLSSLKIIGSENCSILMLVMLSQIFLGCPFMSMSEWIDFIIWFPVIWFVVMVGHSITPNEQGFVKVGYLEICRFNLAKS